MGQLYVEANGGREKFFNTSLRECGSQQQATSLEMA